MTVSDYFNPPPPSDALIFWVIYFQPTDLPGAEFVVRPQFPDAAGQVLASPVSRSAQTLEAARELIPGCAMLYRMPRHESDDPAIVESWF